MMLSTRVTILLIAAILLCGAAIVLATGSKDHSRQGVVAERGADVMPFSLHATTHIFEASAGGGTERVVAKNPSDKEEIALIREHLRHETYAFGRGDFTDPAAIHGAGMPGLETMQAGYQDISFRYRELSDGAEIVYATHKPDLIAAVHAWFDAQLRDHAGDAAMADHNDANRSSHPAPTVHDSHHNGR
jgi:hypothetical protein